MQECLNVASHPSSPTLNFPVPQPIGLPQASLTFSSSNRPSLRAWIDGARVNYTISGLLPYTWYYATILSATSVGFAPIQYMLSICFRTMQTAPSSPPIDFLVITNIFKNGDGALLSWQPPIMPNGVIQGYNVTGCMASSLGQSYLFYPTTMPPANRTCNSSSPNYFAFSVSSTNTTMNLTNLFPFTDYIARIDAFTAKGFGPPSKYHVFTTTEGTPLAAPTVLSVSNVSSLSTSDSRAVRVIWNVLPASVLRGRPSYIIQFMPASLSTTTSTTTTMVLITTSTSTLVTNTMTTSTGTSHSMSSSASSSLSMIRSTTTSAVFSTVLTSSSPAFPGNTTNNAPTVISTNTPAPGSFTSLSSTQTIQTTAVLTVNSSAARASSLPLSFSNASNSSNLHVLPANFSNSTSYHRRRRQAVTLQFTTNGSCSLDNCTFVAEGLAIYESYVVSIAAVTGGGIGPTDVPVFVRTAAGVPLDAPHSFQSSVISSTTVSFSWLPVQTPQGIVANYVIGYSLLNTTNSSVFNTVLLFPATATSETINTFSPDSAYNVAVWARTTAGDGPMANLILSTPPGPSSSSSISLIIGVVVSVVTVSLLVFLVWILLVRRQNRLEQKAKMILGPEPYDFSKLPSEIRELHGSDREYEAYTLQRTPREIPSNCIVRTIRIGGGAFGEVWRAILDEKQRDIPPYPVAVKMLNPGASRQDAIALLQEAHLMAQFDHVHILKLIGVVSIGHPVLVLELCEQGSLEKFLKTTPTEKVTLSLQIAMAMDVCSGMVYLSQLNYVHRDLAARNVLLTENLVCKVSDFGLSRDLVDNAQYYTATIGKFPIRWTAPVSDLRVFCLANHRLVIISLFSPFKNLSLYLSLSLYIYIYIYILSRLPLLHNRKFILSCSSLPSPLFCRHKQ